MDASPTTADAPTMRKVVTVTPQHLAAVAPVVKAAVPVPPGAIRLVPATGKAVSAKVVHVQSATPLPNIIRSSGSPLKSAPQTTIEPVSVPMAQATQQQQQQQQQSHGSRRKANMSHTLVESHTEIIINGKRVEGERRRSSGQCSWGLKIKHGVFVLAEADIIKKADELKREEEEAKGLLKPLSPARVRDSNGINLRLSNSNLKVGFWSCGEWV